METAGSSPRAHEHEHTKRVLTPEEMQQHSRAHESAECEKPPIKRLNSDLGPGDHPWLQVLLSDLLHSPVFDYTMGLIIITNFGFVIIESDMLAEDPDKDLPAWLGIISWIVLGIFLIELILRLYVLRGHFWGDGWNNFDFIIVLMDTFFSIFGLLFGSLFPVSALRILRLGKLARVSKVFRVFPELRLMMAGLIGSMKAIFWGLILLMFCLLIWAVIGVQFVHGVNRKVAESGFYERQGCERCPYAFSSVYQSLLTLFQQVVAGDSWAQMTLPIIEESALTVFFFMGVFVTIGMAVMNLILGVVVNIATQAHDGLKIELEDELLVERMEAHSHLLGLCSEMDTDANGSLTKDELFEGYRNSEGFRETLNDMDIAEEDMEILWTILDEEKTGKVCYNTFVSRCYGMKLSNTQFMLAYIKYYITQIRYYISEKMVNMDKMLVEIEEDIEEEKANVAGAVDKIDKEQEKIESEQRKIDQVLEKDNAEVNQKLQKKEMNGIKGPKRQPSPSRSAGYQSESSGQEQGDLKSSIDEIRMKMDLFLQSLSAMPSKVEPPLCDDRLQAGEAGTCAPKMVSPVTQLAIAATASLTSCKSVGPAPSFRVSSCSSSRHGALTVDL